MQKLLIRFDSNWADEMDIEGFVVMTQDEWDTYKAHTKEYFELTDGRWSFGIGTNEEIEYDSYDDFLGELKTKEISDSEYDMLSRLFTNYNKMVSFGFFPDLDYFDLEYVKEFEDFE